MLHALVAGATFVQITMIVGRIFIWFVFWGLDLPKWVEVFDMIYWPSYTITCGFIAFEASTRHDWFSTVFYSFWTVVGMKNWKDDDKNRRRRKKLRDKLMARVRNVGHRLVVVQPGVSPA